MTETADALEQIETHDPAGEEERTEEPISDLAEQVGRKASTLAVREVELAAAQRMPAIRRAGRDLAFAIVAAVAFAAAFALANWAAVVALANVLPDWLAPLLLAAAWLVLGGVLLVALRHRYRGITAWTGDHAELVKQRAQAREEAEVALRDSISRLGEAIAAEAEAQIRDALVPTADGVVDAGEDILDIADDLTDSIEDAVPGGGLINGVLDFALIPGRLTVKVARAALGQDAASTEADERNADADERS